MTASAPPAPQTPAAEMQRPAGGAEVIYRIEGLTKVYGEGEAQVHALRGVDLQFMAGEMIALLGPSGSGKSTLLNIVGGLDHPTAGKVFYNDLEITALPERKLTAYRRENVGFIFQFYNLVPSLTSLENVALAAEIAEDPMKPIEALEMVGLASHARHFPSQLSGGEQQRVAVARAIVKRPRTLLCDEPTGALDSKTGVMVLEAMERVSTELNATCVLITHNVKQVEMCDRIVSFADGRISDIAVNEDKISPSELSW